MKIIRMKNKKIKTAIVHDFQRSRLDLFPGNNPQRDFDYGIEAMIESYKEFGHRDYMIVIDGLMWDVVTSSQSFFNQEVEEKLNVAGINVSTKGIGASSAQFPAGASRVIESIKSLEGLDKLTIDYIDVHFADDKPKLLPLFYSCEKLKKGWKDSWTQGAVGYKLTKK